MKDIVIFSHSRTDGAYSSTAFSLAKALAAQRRVFYIEQPFTWKDVWKQWNTAPIRNRRQAIGGSPLFYRQKDWPEGFTAIALPPFLPVNFLPEGKFYRLLQMINERLLWKAIRRLISQYQLRDWVFMNVYYPYAGFDFPKDLQPLTKIYYSVDDISQEPYTARHGVIGEQRIVAAYELVLTTSRTLYNKLQAWNTATFYLPNAADVTLFSRSVMQDFVRPADLPPPDKPCIGYVGNVDAARNDFALLAGLAAACPELNVVLIGPLSSPQEAAAAGLRRLSNVFFLGSKPMTELPAYLQHMHCMLIPFLCNTLTKSIYPLKINEYLAAGKPVVATAFSEDIRSFGHVIELADSQEDFIAAVRRSIATDTPDKARRRMQVAAQNTWEARARQLEIMIEDFLQSNTNGVS
ncbi:glycosyltransferase [Rhodoflexus sp.]